MEQYYKSRYREDRTREREDLLFKRMVMSATIAAGLIYVLEHFGYVDVFINWFGK